LSILIMDGHRVLLEFFDAIKDSAAQIYFSALPLMPTQSLLFQLYEHEVPSAVTILHGKPNTWNPCLRLMTGNGSEIRSTAFSPDGGRLVSWSDDTVLRIWDAKTGELGLVLGKHRGGINSMEFDSRGHVVSASSDGIVKVWNPETGELKRSMKGCLSRVFPAGDLHVAALGAQSIKIFDLSTGTLRKIIHDKHTLPHATPSSMKNVLPIWDEGTVANLKHRSFHLNAFSKDGKKAASLNPSNVMRIWDTETGEDITSWNPSGSFECLVFSPDGIHIAACGDVLNIWELTAGKLKVVLRTPAAKMRTIDFSPDGRYIISGDSSGNLRLWDWELGNSQERTLEGHEYWVRTVAFAADGSLVASGAQDHGTNAEPTGSVRFWDSKTGHPTGQVLTGDVRPSVSMAFSPDKRHLVSVDWSGHMAAWNLSNGRIIKRMAGRYSWQRSVSGDAARNAAVAFSADGNLIALAFDTSLTLFDAQTHKPIMDPWNQAVAAPIHALAFSPSGDSIAIACEKEIFIWNRGNLWAASSTPLRSYDCKGRLVHIFDRCIRLVSEAGILTDLEWTDLPDGLEGLIEIGSERRNNFHIREGWVLDMDGRKHCWVPEIHRGQDIHASWGDKLALGGGNGHVMLLRLRLANGV
jgi:WD40 repeat protein